MKEKNEKKKYLRDYLNSVESMEWIVISGLLEKSREVSEKWTNLTKDEAKYLKYINTYTSKWLESIVNRLEGKHVDKLYKWSDMYKLALVDAEGEKKLEREAEKRLQNVSINREMFEDWCSEIMAVNCKNCTKHWVDCDLHRIFIDNSVPESTHDLPGCRYAYEKYEKN